MNLPFRGRNRVTSLFGARNGSQHNGIDLVGDDNKTVFAIASGTVARSNMVTNQNDPTWEWGNYVRIDLPNGTQHYYCHLAMRNVHEGQIINAGDELGVMGNTGKSFGAHLHFEVRNSSGISINPCDTLGIENTLQTYNSPKTGIYKEEIAEDENMQIGIYTKIDKTVSSQLLKEGAFATMENGALHLYQRRIARAVDDVTLSAQFENLKAEMQNLEIIAVTEK